MGWGLVSDLGRPAWTKSFDSGTRLRIRNLMPYFVCGSTRFIIPTSSHLLGLDISATAIGEGSNPSLFTLVKRNCDFKPLALQQFCSYLSGAWVSNGHQCVMQYCWPDETFRHQSQSQVDAFVLSTGTGRVAFNEAHARLDIFLPCDFSYYTIHL